MMRFTQVGSGSKPCGTAVIFGGEKPPRAENLNLAE